MPCSRQVVSMAWRMSLEVVGMFCRVVSTQKYSLNSRPLLPKFSRTTHGVLPGVVRTAGWAAATAHRAVSTARESVA